MSLDIPRCLVLVVKVDSQYSVPEPRADRVGILQLVNPRNAHVRRGLIYLNAMVVSSTHVHRCSVLIVPSGISM